MSWPKIVLLLMAVFAMSCSPAIQRTETLNSFTVPQNWTGGATLDAPSGADWWKEFRDSGLDQAIAKSLEGNIDLRAAAARVDAAAQDARIAGAAQLPSVDFSLGKTRARQNFIGFPIPGGDRAVLTSISGNSSLSFGVSWEADIWGRIRAGKLATLASLEAWRADLEAARLSLTANVAKAWFTAVEADRQVALAR
ncbi:MAG: TolC family protein, partial [bacterium]|nr:TolC family protein [bacterium]